jgi:TRAP-type C4-dicarboxylate transport system substrate-binding protein
MKSHVRLLKHGLLACVAGLVLAGSSPAWAAEFEWKLNSNFAAARAETKLLHELADDIEARAGGAIDITVHDGGSLGLKDADILRWLPTGGAEIGVLNASFIGRDAPELSAVYIQGVIKNTEEHKKALPVFADIQREALKARGLVAVGFMGFPVLPTSVFCRDPGVTSLEALKAKKLRVWSKDLVDTFQALGVSAQIIGQNELYVALKTGVVDCALYPAAFAGSISLQEVTGYASYLFPTASVPYAIVVAEDKWNALTPEIQKAMTDATAALYERTTTFGGAEEAEKTVRETLTKGGVTWQDDFSEADRQAFAEAASKTWESMSASAGGKAVEWRAAVYKAIHGE